jgi:hypothetical protein
VIRHPLLALLVLALTTAAPAVASARAGAPAIARPGLARAGSSAAEARGLVFFLAVDAPPGIAAVGTAHTFPVEQIAEAGRIDFFLGNSLRHVASSERFLVTPGRPFSLPDATIRGDFLVYALDEHPTDVRALEADRSDAVEVDTRVRLLGVPSRGRRDEDDIFGTVVSVTPTRIEVDLDLPQQLVGWGGAPILDAASDRVLGLLQAHIPGDATVRVIAAPIGGVLTALAAPLEGGSGQSFASFGDGDGDDDGEDALAAAGRTPSRSVGQATESPKLLGRESDAPTRIHLEIEYPAQGAVVAASTCGVFVSGRAIAMRGDMRHFDVVMVIDTSRSTVDPTGADIDGDGKVGVRRLGRLGSIFGSGSTDNGDSILAAEVAAARQLLRGLDPRSTRVGLVAFAGDPAGGGWSRRQARPAYTLEPLTRDYTRIDRSLDYLVQSEPEGSTHMAAGVDQATIELLGLRGASSQSDAASEKVVFFFTDGQPTLPYGPGAEADNVRAVLRAANRAQRGGIRIHSFAIGPDALEGPIATVEMATRTDGFFTPVRHPGDLIDVVEEVSFANLESVTLESATTGEAANPFRTTADGTWAGLVQMQPGTNQVRVQARSDDGVEVAKSLSVSFVPEAKTSPVPKAFVARRNRLLEDCLREAKRLRLEAVRAHQEKVRRDLRVEIERERAKARRRADEQRKQLQIGVDDEEE